MAEQLTDRIWHLDLGSVNAFLANDAGTLTLVDAGTPFDANDVVSEISDAGFDVVDVDRVLITHYDLDHVGALAKLTPDLQATVYAGDPDASWLTGEDAQPWGNHKGFFQHLLGLLIKTPDLDVERVHGGDRIGSFTAYETPGHTPGHVSFISREYSTGILGDMVRAKNGQLAHLPWILCYDSSAAHRSVENLAARAPDFDVACVGHGEPITSGASDDLVRLARE